MDKNRGHTRACLSSSCHTIQQTTTSIYYYYYDKATWSSAEIVNFHTIFGCLLKTKHNTTHYSFNNTGLNVCLWQMKMPFKINEFQLNYCMFVVESSICKTISWTHYRIAQKRHRWTCVCIKNVSQKMFQKCRKSFLNDLYLISMRQTGWKHRRKRKRNSLETETTVRLHDDTTFVLQLMAKPPLHRVYIVAWIYASVYESWKRYGVICCSSSSGGGGGGDDRTNMFWRCRIATRGKDGL